MDRLGRAETSEKEFFLVLGVDPKIKVEFWKHTSEYNRVVVLRWLSDRMLTGVVPASLLAVFSEKPAASALERLENIASSTVATLG